MYASCLSIGSLPIVLDLIISVGKRSRPLLFITEKTLNADSWFDVETTTKKQRFNKNLQNFKSSSSSEKASAILSLNTLQLISIWRWDSVFNVMGSLLIRSFSCTFWIYLLKKSWSHSLKKIRGWAGISSNSLPSSCKYFLQRFLYFSVTKALPIAENKIDKVVKRCCPSITSA